MEIKRSEATEILKAYLPNYLESKGLNLRHGNACPCCSGGQHKKNVFHYDKRANRVTCFSCGLRGDIFELVRNEYNLGDIKDNFNTIIEKTADLLGFTLVNEKGEKLSEGISDIKDLPKPLFIPSDEPEEEIDYFAYIKRAASQNDFKYLESRGISKETQTKFMIGFDPYWKNPKVVKEWKEEGKDISRIPYSPRCIIPNSRYSYLARDTRKDLTENQSRYSKQAVGKKRLFNYKALSKAKTIFVVEGEIDALSIIEAGFVGIGLCSAHNVTKLIEELKRNNNIDQKFIVMLDGDETGRKKSATLCEGLDGLGLKYIDSALYFPSTDLDPNQKLVSNKARFVSELKFLYETVNEKDKNIESTINIYKNISKSMLSYMELLKENKSIEEIAKIRNVKVSTVESTILKLYEIGKIDNVELLIDKKYSEEVLGIINSSDWDGKLNYIKNRVPKECSYACIRAVILKNEKEKVNQPGNLDHKIEHAKSENDKLQSEKSLNLKNVSGYNMAR